MKVMQTFAELGVLLVRQRPLIIEMARRELSDRYVGQAFGSFWTLIHPIFQMALYVFVFAFVFRTKIGGANEMPLDYTTYLLAGLIPWMSFQESILKSCVAITSNASLVKQVVFPIEVLPIKGVIASMAPHLISLSLLIGYVLVTHKSLPLTYALIPLLLVMQMVAMAGVGYLFAALGTYFRDLKDLVQIFCAGGVYLMPIVYLPEWVPPLFRPIIYINPFSYLVWCYQDALYFGRFQHPMAWITSGVLSISVLAIGYGLFRKLKPGFGNVL